MSTPGRQSQQQKNSCLEAAVEWYGRGVVPLPVLPSSKRPAIPWAKLQKAKPPLPLVKRWFLSRPDHNLGLICGEVSGNLVVADFDNSAEYWGWRGANSRWARTYTVQTSRGFHVYLRVREPVGKTLAMVGGDLKGSGYVLAPPSLHPDGWQYRAVEPSAPILGVDTLEDAGLVVIQPKPRILTIPQEKRKGSGSEGSLIEAIKAELPLTRYLVRITDVRPSSPDGIWLMARCPLHDDHTPSMWVNAAWGGCRCFKPGCRGHDQVMDVIDLHAERFGLTIGEAVWDLAAELGL